MADIEVEPKTLAEAAILISTLVKQIKTLESRIAADNTQEPSLRPIIEELKVEKDKNEEYIRKLNAKTQGELSLANSPS